MYEPGLRVVPPTVQLRQAPSPWSSSFPSKWHYTEKSPLSLLKKASADVETSKFLTIRLEKVL